MVEHHHRHHAVVLTELSLKDRLDQSSRDVIELNVCRTQRCCAFSTWIGQIVMMYDYINRVVLSFRFWSTRVHGLTLPARCYASPWSCVCVGNFWNQYVPQQISCPHAWAYPFLSHFSNINIGTITTIKPEPKDDSSRIYSMCAI